MTFALPGKQLFRVVLSLSLGNPLRGINAMKEHYKTRAPGELTAT